MEEPISYRKPIETLCMYAEVVDQHDEVLDVWRDLGIKDSLVLHVDAHSDMVSKVDVDLSNGRIDHLYPNIENFLAIGAYEGIIDNLYWLNPHHKKKKIRLQQIASSNDSLELVLQQKDDDVGVLNWKDKKLGGDLYLETSESYLKKDILDYKDNFILDIDLDAFCAKEIRLDGRIVHNLTLDNYSSEAIQNHDVVNGWQERIDETISFLRKLKYDPRLITIARSTENMNEDETFVPIDKVDQVQDYLLAKLQTLYAVPREYR